VFRFVNNGTPVFNVNLINSVIQYPHSTAGQNKVLVSDATGNASWANSSINTGFAAYNSLSQSIPPNSSTILNFNTEEFDDGNAFSGNAFTAPTAGVYLFNATLVWNPFTAGVGYVGLEIYKNGIQNKVELVPATTATYNSLSTSVTMKLNAGDVITVRAFQQSGTNQSTAIGGIQYTRFSGFRVY